MTNEILEHFSFKHLPEHLQQISKPFAELAYLMDASLPDDREKQKGLDKLLEAKDCCVRSFKMKDK